MRKRSTTPVSALEHGLLQPCLEGNGEMQGKRLIRSLRLRNFLSYGDAAEALELQPLNVLIGPNASGKSNLLAALALLRAAPKDLAKPIREGGGVREWLRKEGEELPVAEIEVTIEYPHGNTPLRHRLGFSAVGPRHEVVCEVLEDEHALPSCAEVVFYYRNQDGKAVLNLRDSVGPSIGQPGVSNGGIHHGLAGLSGGAVRRFLPVEDLKPQQSILSQRKDPAQFPEITHVGTQFERFALYREWRLGAHAPPRTPQPADLPGDYLLPNGSNLGLVLNDLEHRAGAKKLILEKLNRLYERAEEITTKVHGGTVQIFVHERGTADPIPATRVSDGTLQYLCLLTLLCHPEPPPLVCIEEPELGLHPDILPTIADLLVDAAQRTQLIVTTHSDVLVSALSDLPEAIVVCEQEQDGTRLRRLGADELREWLSEYSLGELWRMGEIGGTRW